jgi:hypothetical protein
VRVGRVRKAHYRRYDPGCSFADLGSLCFLEPARRHEVQRRGALRRIHVGVDDDGLAPAKPDDLHAAVHTGLSCRRDNAVLEDVEDRCIPGPADHPNAILQPSSVERLDIGVKLKGVRPEGRFEVAGSWTS